LQTLRPEGIYDVVLAWWIWFTTIANASLEEKIGWTNLIYVGLAYALGPLPFLILTSFRHYLVYITTFAYRQPPVSHGEFMRDVLFYKTIAVSHLSRRLLPVVELPRDAPGLLLALAGFAITMLATARLGMVRTYFGAELGYVKPQWISDFPYGWIPHPMIGKPLSFIDTSSSTACCGLLTISFPCQSANCLVILQFFGGGRTFFQRKIHCL